MIYEQYFKEYSPTIKEMWPKDIMAEELSEEERLKDLKKIERLRKSLKSDDNTKPEKKAILKQIAILEERTHIPYRVDEKTLVLIPFNVSKRRIEEKLTIIISKLKMQ